MTGNLSKLALELRKKGDNLQAIKLFQEHLSQYPNDLYAKHNLAAAFGDIGRFSDSATVIAEAITDGLNKSQSWLVYARALSNTGKDKDAISAYRSSLLLEPLNADVHKELAQLIWMTTGDYQGSLTVLGEFIVSHPEAIHLRILQAELCGQMGNYADQYRLMKVCYELSDKQPAMQYYLSKAALAKGDFSDALKYGALTSAAFPNDLQCTIHYINCLLAEGKPDTALKLVQGIRKQFPFDQHLLALQATCWRLKGDDKYEELYDYNRFVKQIPLGVPSGWSSLEHYMNDLEMELDEEHHFKSHPFFLSVRHGSQIPSITSSSRKAMKSFASAVKEPMKAYISGLSDSGGFIQNRSTGAAKLISAWSVKLFSDGFHVNHVHQEGWLSSACHVRLAGSDNTNTEDKKAGWLKLGEPGPVCSPVLLPDKYVEPKRGHMIIFPSYMWHGTVPFQGIIDRLTVAADFQPA